MLPSEAMRCVLIVALIALADTHARAQPNGVDPVQATFNGLIAADRAFAALAVDESVSGGIAAAFSDTVIMPVFGKGLIRGRHAAINQLALDSPDASSHAEWESLGGGVSADGLQGFTFGQMRLISASADRQSFKYLAYWIRSAEGWRIAAYKRVRSAQAGANPAMKLWLPAQQLKPELSEAMHRKDALTLRRAERQFSDEAQSAGLGPAFAKFGHADAINLGGPQSADVIVGADNIARAVSSGEAPGGSSLSWSAQEVIVASSGDLGVSIGWIRYNARAADGSERPAIPFFTIWQRAGRNDAWRYIAE